MLGHLALPGHFKLRFRGLRQSVVSMLRCRSKKLALNAVPSGFRAAPVVESYLGATVTFVQLLSLLQLHLLVPATESEFWSLQERPWFPEAFYLFAILRSSDFVSWCCQYAEKFGNASRLHFEAAFVQTYSVALGRNCILTKELQCHCAQDTDYKIRNKTLLVATDGGNFHVWKSSLRQVLDNGLSRDVLHTYAQACRAIEGAGDFVANSLIEFWLTCPDLNGREHMFSAKALVFLGNNTRDFLARIPHGDAASKLARVASAARALVPESFEVASCQDMRTVQLNACKLAQVLKGLHTGVLRKPRRLRAAAVTFDFSDFNPEALNPS